MNYALLIVKTSLKQFWDIDPCLIDNLLLNARIQTSACIQGLAQSSVHAGKTVRNFASGIAADLQSWVASA